MGMISKKNFIPHSSKIIIYLEKKLKLVTIE